MKAVKNTLAIILGILALSFVLDKVIYHTLSSIEEKVYTGLNVGKFNQYLVVKDSVDLIFYGNSRTNHHFNPNNFNVSAFNMGIDNKGIAYYWTAIKLLPKEKKQNIVINIDTEHLFDARYVGEDLQSLAYLYNKNNKVKEELDRINAVNPLMKFYWCIGYNSKVLSIITNYINPRYNYKKYNGFDPLIVSDTQKSIRDKIFENKKVVNCDEKAKNLKPNEVAKKYLKLISDFAKNNNKTLLVITSPIRNDNCKEDNKALQKLMEELSINYWDLSDLYINDKDPDLWKDNIHLSNKGANEFSAYCAGKLKF